MWADINPQSARCLFFGKGPFVFHEAHGLIEPLGCENAIASETNEMKAGKPGSGGRHPIPFRQAFHIAINSGQNCLVRQRSRAHDLVCDAFGKDLTVKNDDVSAVREYLTDRIWYALV